MKYVVVIATYNEAENVPALLLSILGLGPEYQAVVVDDSSPDGTADLVSQIAAEHGRVHLLQRPAKLGYGTAYLDGFREALSMDADYIVQMDADYSHNPEDVPRLVEAAQEADLVIGSRYIRGGSVEDWPLQRRIISAAGNFVARLLLGLPIRDCSGGFKCFTRSTLESLDFAAIRSKGFALHYEVYYLCYHAGKRFREIPIKFINRQAGKSKLSRRVILEALTVMLRLRFKRTRAELDSGGVLPGP